jgi:addiction module RelE/StbE family toxin
MVKIRVTFKKDFRKSTKILSQKNKDKLSDLVILLSQNPFHSKLHTKSLSGDLTGLFSFRITRDWRVMFKFVSPEEVLIIKVRHRKDIYR